MAALEDPRHQRLLEWEMTPVASRIPGTQVALAEELGVKPRTLRDWRDSDEFQAAWRDAFKETAGSMERVKQLLDQMFTDAADPSLDAGDRHRATKLYVDISRQIAPPEPEVEPSRRAQELSNEELEALLSDAALAELSFRLGVDV